MSKAKTPVTTAVRALRAGGIDFVPHLYDYVERGGTKHSSAAIGVEEHAVIKTIVLVDADGKPMLALMHGDLEVSTRNLARHLGVKSVTPADPATATRHTGYAFGGTSPFGTRSPLPIYMPESILELPKIYINGGKRGFLVEIDPKELRRVLEPQLVELAATRG